MDLGQFEMLWYHYLALAFLFFYIFYGKKWMDGKDERDRAKNRERMDEYMSDPEKARHLKKMVARGIVQIDDPELAKEYGLE